MYIHNERLEDTKEFSKQRVEDYKDAFSKGYQTNNGIVPYHEEIVQNEVFDSEEDEYLEEEPEQLRKPERWDD